MIVYVLFKKMHGIAMNTIFNLKVNREQASAVRGMLNHMLNHFVCLSLQLVISLALKKVNLDVTQETYRLQLVKSWICLANGTIQALFIVLR